MRSKRPSASCCAATSSASVPAGSSPCWPAMTTTAGRRPSDGRRPGGRGHGGRDIGPGEGQHLDRRAALRDADRQQLDRAAARALPALRVRPEQEGVQLGVGGEGGAAGLERRRREDDVGLGKARRDRRRHRRHRNDRRCRRQRRRGRPARAAVAATSARRRRRADGRGAARPRAPVAAAAAASAAAPAPAASASSRRRAERGRRRQRPASVARRNDAFPPSPLLHAANARRGRAI